ncbi:MAG: HAD-IA family hydrolase, partial [Planctomycetota bacterium]
GTLVDSEPITTRVLVDFVEEFGLQLDHHEAIGWFAGRDMAGISKMIEKRLCRELPSDFVEQFRHRQAAALETDVRPIDGAVELLNAIRIPIALASNAPRAKIEINLRVSGLTGFFPDERVFSAYDIEIWKPEPDLFIHAARAIGFDPAKCLIVEDSPAGFEAAARAGAHVACFLPGSKNESGENEGSENEPGADPFSADSRILDGAASVHSISKLKELLPIIEGRSSRKVTN